MNTLGNEDYPKPSLIARGLEVLGHIEIVVSPTNGGWQSINVCPGRLRLLPWDVEINGDRKTQAILSGQIDWNGVLGALEDSPGEVTVDITRQPNPFLPPRVRLMSANETHLEEIAEKWGLEVSAPFGLPGWPPCWRGIESNVVQIGEWQEGLVEPSEDTTIFSPLVLKDVTFSEERIRDLCCLSGDRLLATQEKFGYSDYYLLDTKNNMRAQISRDVRQEARWLCYQRSADLFKKMKGRVGGSSGNGSPSSFSIPYRENDGTVVWPIALRPPASLLAQLVSCSGLMPSPFSAATTSTEICKLNAGEELETFSSPFFFPTGANLECSRQIPLPVAEGLGKALGLEIGKIT